MGSNVIGDLQVQISGDYSKLSDDLAQSVIAAEVGGQKIASAFTTAAGGTDDWTEALGRSRAATQEEVNAIGQAADQLSKYGTSVENVLGPERDHLDVLEQMPKSYTEMTAAQQRAVEKMNEQAQSSQQASDATKSFDLNIGSLIKSMAGFAGIQLSIQGLRAAIDEAFTSFAQLQRATESLTALTGSARTANDAIDQLRRLAQDEALSFPSLLKADQQMAAFGITTRQSVALLAAAGDASRATGKEFDAVASSIERIVESGAAMGRTLVNVGLTTKDLGGVMGVTAGEASKLFKSLDEATRVDVITAALAKFKGLAADTSNDLTGSWQQLANAAKTEFARIGQELEGTGQAFTSFAKGAIGALGSVADFFVTFGKGVSSTTSEITNTLRNAFVSLGASTEDYAKAATAATESNKGYEQSMGLLIITARQLFGQFPEYTFQFNNLLKQFQQGEIDGRQFTSLVQSMENQFKLLHPAVQTSTTATKSFTEAVADLKAKLDAHKITHAEYAASLQKLIAAHSDAAKATKEHKAALDDLDKLLLGVEASVKKAYDSVAVYNDIVGAFGHDSLQAAAAQREMLSALKAVGLQAGDTEPALAKVGAAFEVIKAHTKDWNPELQKLIDELGRFPTLSEQIAAGLTVIVSQTDKTRDAFGFLKGASTAAYQAMIDGGKNGVEVMLNLSDAVTSGGQVIASGMSPAVAAMKSFTAAAEEAVAAFGDLSSSALSFGSQLGIGTGGTSAPGGRGKKGLGGAFNLSNPYWDLGTPDQIEAAFQDTLASVKFTDRQMEDYFYQAQFQLEQAALANYYRQHPFGAETPSSATPPRSTTAAGSAPAAAPTSAPISPALQYFLNQGISLDQIGSLDTSLQNLNATVANASTAIAGSFAALTPVIQQATTQIAASVQQQAASFSRLSDVLAPVNAPATASGPPASFMALGGNSPTSGPVTYGASNIVNIGNIALQPDEAHLLDLMTVILQRRGVRF
jgi:hypothetical protein